MHDMLALGIVLTVMYGIARGSWPYLAINRTSMCIIGAAALFTIGALNDEQAWQAIDIPTLVILAGMMVINGELESTGFLGYAAYQITHYARHGNILLGLIMVICGLLSALFLNDTVVFLLTPLVIMIARQTECPPIPLLIGVAVSANIGSAATITGNPQNIVIGNSSQIGFLPFLQIMGPICMVALVMAWGMIVFAYRYQLGPLSSMVQRPPPTRNAPQLILSLGVFISGLIWGISPAVAVLIAVAVLLVRKTVTPAQLLAPIDGGLLLFFGALFIVTAAFRYNPIATQLTHAVTAWIAGDARTFGIVAAGLSNLISNVPAVLMLQSLVPYIALPQANTWVLLAASSTFAGNSSVLASVANLIVVERAAQQGVNLGFWEYLYLGLPITVVTLGFALWWLT